MPLTEVISPAVTRQQRAVVSVLNPYIFKVGNRSAEVYFDRFRDSFVKELDLSDEEYVFAVRFAIRRQLSIQDIVQEMRNEKTPGTFIGTYGKLRSHGVDVPPTKEGRKKRLELATDLVTMAATGKTLEEISNAVSLPLEALHEEAKPLLRRVLVEKHGKWLPTQSRIHVLGRTEDERVTYTRIRQNVLYNAVYSKSAKE